MDLPYGKLKLLKDPMAQVRYFRPFSRVFGGHGTCYSGLARRFLVSAHLREPYGGIVSMSKCVSRLLVAMLVLLLPTLAAAQTSAIAGK